MIKSPVFNSNHTTAVIEMGHTNNIATPEIAKNKSFDGSPDRKWNRELVGGSASSLFTMVNGAVEGAETFGTKSVDSKIEMNSDYWKFYDDVIQDEIKKGREVDECLRDGAKTFRQIFDKLIEG